MYILPDQIGIGCRSTHRRLSPVFIEILQIIKLLNTNVIRIIKRSKIKCNRVLLVIQLYFSVSEILFVSTSFLLLPIFTDLLNIFKSVKTIGAKYSPDLIFAGSNTLKPEIPPKSNSPFCDLNAAP